MGCHTTHSAEETAHLGRRLAGLLQGGQLVTFSGGLGAGKTTFCHGLAEGLACIDPVSSPTFAIVNYYRGPRPLAHFDAWRISTEEDLEAAGFYDFLAKGAVVVVEWSENIAALLPPADVRIHIEMLSETDREILIEGAEGL